MVCTGFPRGVYPKFTSLPTFWVKRKGSSAVVKTGSGRTGCEPGVIWRLPPANALPCGGTARAHALARTCTRAAEPCSPRRSALARRAAASHHTGALGRHRAGSGDAARAAGDAVPCTRARAGSRQPQVRSRLTPSLPITPAYEFPGARLPRRKNTLHDAASTRGVCLS